MFNNNSTILLDSGRLQFTSLNIANNNAIVADNGAIIRFDNTTVTNNGSLRAEDRAELEFFTGSNVIGGDIATSTGALADVVGASTFDAPTTTMGSHVRITNDVALTLKTSFTNDGDLFLNDNGSGDTTALIIDGTVAYASSGTINASNTFNNQIRGGDGSALLNNAMTLSVDSGRVQIQDLAINNSGALQADNGATLRFINATIDNMDGVIGTHNVAVTQLGSGVWVSEGEVSTSLGGVVEIAGSTTFDAVEITTGSNLRIANDQA